MTLPADPTPLEEGRRARLGYVPALDGMRAVAVVAVLLFHAGVSWATGGFLGVDVFFVLSGYLITTLLIEEVADHGSVNLAAFWARRARRLIPALLVVVIIVVVGARWFAPAHPPSSVRLDGAGALAYFANWRFIVAGASYFVRTAGPSPLQHTWSLAVEEQFYLVWPIVALVLLRRRTWLLGAVAGAGAVASAVAMAVLYQPGHDTSRVYLGTDTHLFVVLIGALLAVLLHRRGDATVTVRYGMAEASVAAAAVVVAAMWWVSGDDGLLYRGGFVVVALATSVIVAAVVLVPDGFAARVLACQPLPWIGRISYALYLWHWPLFLYMTAERTGLHGSGLLAARFAAALAAATVSTYVIERPVRVGALLSGLRSLAVLPAAAAVIAAVLVVAAAQDSPVAARTAAPPPLTPAAAAAAAAKASHVPGPERRALFVGDSVAMTLAQGIEQQAKKDGIVVYNHAVLGCGVVRGGPYRYFGSVSAQPAQCEDWPDRWRDVVFENDPDVSVLLVGRWEVMDRMRDGEWQRIGEPAFDAYLSSEVDRAIEVLQSHGGDVLVATAPYYKRGERSNGGIWPEDEPARVDQFNQLLRAAAGRHPGVRVIDLNAETSRGGTYTATIDGIRMRYDGVHFTPAGARHLYPWLLTQLR